ncbi:DUF6881 domain-containing protein [Tardiphaga sp. 172_B4_N1_3]|jgi:hypothetical protein|uniref:DUF6881 domain-containing protein n=1 Tax=Tardiphaga sp. 172_B4_N1_3 TaxID=3240787 RepID=UPI003F8C6DBE
MKYLKVKWEHSFEDQPVLLYSELDHELREIRKVEYYADGRMDFADREGSSGHTRLSVEPLPSLEAIAAQAEFEPMIIPAAEFETVWAQAKVT